MACPFLGAASGTGQASAELQVGACPFAGIVKATAPAVAPKVLDIVQDFYPRMFRNNPEAQAFFNPANQFADPPLQRLALANAVVAYASNIDHVEKLAGALELISNKHCGLGVQADHYSIVHKNLMESIQHVLGEIVTPEIGQGWSEAVLALAKALIEKEAGLYELAAARQGGWRGVKDFRISKIHEVAKNCKEFTFTPIEGEGPIDFTPGQYLTLHLKVEGATPRHYTITSAPGQNFLQCCPKHIPGGFVSSALHSMKEGDVVGIAPPFGTFTLQDKPAVLLSAGIGITPMKCFVATHPEKVELLVHVDATEESHPYREHLLGGNIKTHFIYTRKQGRPSPEQLVQDLLKPYIERCDFYVCGPASFRTGIKAALEAAGVKTVHEDTFGPALSGV